MPSPPFPTVLFILSAFIQLRAISTLLTVALFSWGIPVPLHTSDV